MSTLRYTTAEKDLMLSMSLDLLSGSNISDVSINYGSLIQYSGSIYPSSSFSGSIIVPTNSNLIFMLFQFF